MIWESSYWKEPLLKSALWLEKINLSENTQEHIFVRIEKELFIGFYSIRKLLETVKLTDATKSKKYELEWNPNIEEPNHFNWHNIDRLYNLNQSSKESRDIGFICNLFIHSYVFIISGQNKLDGVYISTDKLKEEKVYFVSLENILSIYRLVGRDYSSAAEYIKI